MTILTIRTDKPEAEIGLYKDGERLDYDVWQAHRQLAETLHIRIKDLLVRSSIGMEEVQGIVCYKGPGSFTGLRIGLTVGNALAHSLHVPIAGETGDDWITYGIDTLNKGNGSAVCYPEYGADVHITLPKH